MDKLERAESLLKDAYALIAEAMEIVGDLRQVKVSKPLPQAEYIPAIVQVLMDDGMDCEAASMYYRDIAKRIEELKLLPLSGADLELVTLNERTKVSRTMLRVRDAINSDAGKTLFSKGKKEGWWFLTNQGKAYYYANIAA